MAWLYSRRQVLQSLGGSVGGIPVLSQQRKDKPRVEIGVYVTESLRDKHGSGPANVIGTLLSDIFNREFDFQNYIGPESVVSVPDRANANSRSALEWWREHPPDYRSKPYEHSNILLFHSDQTAWQRSGIAYLNYPYAVVTGAESVMWRQIKHLIVHETSHNFSLRHSDGAQLSDGASIMNPAPSTNGHNPALRYSTQSKAQIQEIVRN